MRKLQLKILAERLQDSIVKFEQAQEDFADNKAAWINYYQGMGNTPSDCKVKASQVSAVKEAATDCAYFRDRATMYATAIQAVIAMQEQGEN